MPVTPEAWRDMEEAMRARTDDEWLSVLRLREGVKVAPVFDDAGRCTGYELLEPLILPPTRVMDRFLAEKDAANANPG